MSTYVSNHEQWITTDVATFCITQRNTGFEPNDGAWIAHQSSELYWRHGALHEHRPNKFLGVFATHDEAMHAVHTAEPQPVTDVLLLR